MLASDVEAGAPFEARRPGPMARYPGVRKDRMGPSGSMLPLSEAEVLVVDCQAPAAAPRGHLLELGWARLGQSVIDRQGCLIAMPEGERVPAAVARITGITTGM